MESVLLYELYKSINMNLSFSEIALLLFLAYIVWCLRCKCSWGGVAYSLFLILYVTLLRRPSGYEETIQLNIYFFTNAGILVGNLLNFLLYFPLGWCAAKWKLEYMEQWRKSVLLIGTLFSVFCEIMQFMTGKGMADINDVVFNALGMKTGIWMAEMRKKRNVS